jgi:hypothetical protein
MKQHLWIEPPEEWEGTLIDPWPSGGPYVVWVVAEDIEHARMTYLAYRHGSDEQAIAFIRSGSMAGTLADARESALLAGIEGKTPTIFRIVGTPDI